MVRPIQGSFQRPTRAVQRRKDAWCAWLVLRAATGFCSRHVGGRRRFDAAAYVFN